MRTVQSGFPFLKGRFKRLDGAGPCVYGVDLFPFLKGRFKSIFREIEDPGPDEFPFLKGRFKRI